MTYYVILEVIHDGTPNARRYTVMAKRDEVTGEWRKLHNTELHALYSSPDIIRNLKSRRLRWAGHVARMGEPRNAYRVLVGRPEGKRPLGRPRRRWEDNIKMDLREVGYDDRDWINLAQDRDRWRAYVRAAMNLRDEEESIATFNFLDFQSYFRYNFNHYNKNDEITPKLVLKIEGIKSDNASFFVLQAFIKTHRPSGFWRRSDDMYCTFVFLDFQLHACDLDGGQMSERCHELHYYCITPPRQNHLVVGGDDDDDDDDDDDGGIILAVL
ncbi:hypothetical protein ANN_04308 [Periplaneta americana]|uniref:Uncharacterized protein n=1 Tax=Periplaneta americana TaxID=6978 RepID=A0ABQ8TA10_PERAM|nr:hypothetical protein ANN_04308 [Periplaneta americana]